MDVSAGKPNEDGGEVGVSPSGENMFIRAELRSRCKEALSLPPVSYQCGGNMATSEVRLRSITDFGIQQCPLSPMYRVSIKDHLGKL